MNFGITNRDKKRAKATFVLLSVLFAICAVLTMLFGVLIPHTEVVKSLGENQEIKGLVDVNRTRFNIDVKRVDVTTTEFMRLLGNIASLKTPEKVLPYINRTERLDISGSFKGLISSFDATARMKLGSGGTLDALCSMHPSDDGRRFDVDLTTNSLNVARLLSMDKPINASFTAKGSALVDGSALPLRDALGYREIAFTPFLRAPCLACSF